MHSVKKNSHPLQPSTPSALSLKDVTVAFGKNMSSVIEHVSLEIPPGKISVIIGPNGSGKTTLIRAILGYQPHEGNIEYFGEELSRQRRNIGYVPQRYHTDPLSPITVREFLQLFSAQPSLVTDGRSTKVIDRFGVSALLSHALRSLSGGQVQRVLLCRALMGNPTLLLLDEPEAGIDVSGGEDLFHFLQEESRERGLTVLMASHELEMVSQHADNVICLNHTLLCSGEPHHVLKGATLQQLFGAHTGVYVHQ